MAAAATKPTTRRKSTPISTHSIVSMFAGCGGLDLGFLGNFSLHGEKYPKLAFSILKAYDHDATCIKTYTDNIGSHGEVADLADFDVATMPKADVLIAGFPCQDFSICGPRAGLTSKRGRLYQALTRYMTVHHGEGRRNAGV